MKKQRGITLIALVITIIVLLILAGISIASLSGENGILAKANKSKIETRSSSVEEIKDIWKLSKEADKIDNEKTAQTLPEVLDDLQNRDLITSEERTQIEENGHVVIGSRDISFVDGLETQYYTITSGDDIVNFVKVVKEGQIATEKPGYTNYSIVGVSTEKEGEYVSSGSLTGKSGNLEIVGDIQDATFKYYLTNFMQGDEIFYIKIDIDGENYYEELQIIQGNVVAYEDDFMGIEYASSKWTLDENENYSDGKAQLANTTDGAAGVSFSFVGTGIELISRVNSQTGYIKITLDENSNNFISLDTDSNGTDFFQTDIFAKNICKNLESKIHTFKIYIYREGTMGMGPYFYLDAIKIYK